VQGLNAIAAERGQTLAQTALAWALRDPRMTSVIIGASSVKQLEDNVASIGNLEFSEDELAAIDKLSIG
jgi:L-glyceraldehyde 3-phosphate reductase